MGRKQADPCGRAGSGGSRWTHGVVGSGGPLWRDGGVYAESGLLVYTRQHGDGIVLLSKRAALSEGGGVERRMEK